MRAVRQRLLERAIRPFVQRSQRALAQPARGDDALTADHRPSESGDLLLIAAPHRLSRAFSLTLSLLALALALLLAPASALAHVSSRGCARTSSAAGHGASSCAAAARRRKANERPAHTKRLHATHTTAKARHERRSAAKSAHTTYVAALCEDSSLPVRAADGSFSCDDGSEPVCESGAKPILSASQSSLLCALAAGQGEAEEAGGEEAASEEGGEEAAGEEAAS